jgi:hypothetical protein
VKQSRGLRVAPNEVVEAGLEVLLTMDVKVLLGSHLYVALKPQNALREGDGGHESEIFSYQALDRHRWAQDQRQP